MNALTRPDVAAQPLEAALMAAPEAVTRLAEILALEFAALKTRDLASFESIQDEKNAVLQNLAALAEWVAAQKPMPSVWQQQLNSLQQSKQDHLRNIQLLQRQLEAVKGTLQALHGDSSAPAVDLYDRMGKIARSPGAWGHQLA
ncbi:MAG: flagellar protein FlgN [Limnohabitans sp.]|jgi:flagellar biosynthesis/type III secretory pathway chaperone|uniref:flagellar protein FlgN n=1 Tax=Limnohabitans sp. TaxID=1907725 RepID=UPI0025DD508C|nr:flagellar protein FlgN [Limnohabitans sp.]MCO4088190.1 flagellar protein FlgN [Limnohabitans sp.]